MTLLCDAVRCCVRGGRNVPHLNERGYDRGYMLTDKMKATLTSGFGSQCALARPAPLSYAITVRGVIMICAVFDK